MPHLICLNFVISFTFPPCLQICYLCIDFAKITMLPFLLILTSFKSRISVRGNSFTIASVSMVSILFMVPFFLSLPLQSLFIPLLLMLRPICGIVVWGHPQQIVLHHVLHKHLSLRVSHNNFVCSHCLAGKMHQLPFPKSVSITSRPLEIVHSDVWGPAPITSTNGTRYYVTFVDNFTKITWFFPLHHKCQVLSSFMHFKSTMENLLSCKLKILRTDCGGEYSKHEFQSFCSSTGILHQFICPHTSQQNGVAERKHRHIVDMGLTLMSQASLPLTFWPYAFSTSVFLINRLPSP
jgi:hypothetical protein